MRLPPSLRHAAMALAAALCAHTASAQRQEDLLQAATAEQPAVVATLERLVNIETGTGHGPGLAAMATLLERELRALGADVTRVAPAGEAVVGDNIVARLRGRGGKRLLLMAHMDTVYAAGTLAKAPFRIEGNKAYGPGIADAKSGIAVILHTLALLKAKKFDGFDTLTVLFNSDEEKGSRGSAELIQKHAAEHDAILSFEPGWAPKEGLLLGTSGVSTVQAKVKGLAAHAGAAPETGVNALTEAADLLLRTQDLDDRARGFRFNWTLAQAGTVPNIIPDEAVLTADVRYSNTADLDAALARLRESAQKKRLPKAEVTIDVSRGRPPFNAGDAGRALVDKAVAIYKEVGADLAVYPRGGGGTDAAFAGLSGKPVIEYLGLPGYGYHSNQAEYVLVDAIPRRLYLAARMVMDLGQGR